MADGPELVPQDGIGIPDHLQRLWTPHRMAYVTGGSGADRTADAAQPDAPACPFCRIPTLSDEDGLIVARGEQVYAVLNLFPYNPGHLMVLPFRHMPDYTDLDGGRARRVQRVHPARAGVIRSVSAPHGFNIGINAGSAAGAGIAEHLHQHVVPRWGGDSNFMPVDRPDQGAAAAAGRHPPAARAGLVAAIPSDPRSGTRVVG